MSADAGAIIGALGISLCAVVVWLVLTLRMIWFTVIRHVERRPFILAMPAVGLLAAFGTLASAVAFAQQQGFIDLSISREALTLIASMGRGGLLMGGVIALAYYRPKHL